MTDCKLFTSHALALVCIARDHNTRLRDIADCLGITERATQRIVSELCAAGYLTKHHHGSRNFYEIHPHAGLRQPLVEGHDLGQVLAPLLQPAA